MFVFVFVLINKTRKKEKFTAVWVLSAELNNVKLYNVQNEKIYAASEIKLCTDYNTFFL